MSDSAIRRIELGDGSTPSSASDADDSYVPRRCTLGGFAQEALAHPGMGIRRLKPLSRLRVQTLNTLYRLTVLDPWESRVLVEGGRFFAQPTEAVLCGSSFGGSLLKLRWIGCGMRMEINSEGLKIVTSPVRSVEIHEDDDLPGPF